MNKYDCVKWLEFEMVLVKKEKILCSDMDEAKNLQEYFGTKIPSGQLKFEAERPFHCRLSWRNC